VYFLHVNPEIFKKNKPIVHITARHSETAFRNVPEPLSVIITKDLFLFIFILSSSLHSFVVMYKYETEIT
jgi:hypothetical protein